MTNELKDPGWSPAEIPGLVRKKGRKTEPAVSQTVGHVPSPPPAVEIPTMATKDPAPEKVSPIATAKAVAKESLNDAVAFKQETAYTDSVEAHEELMDCLVNARTLVQKIQAAADSYYIMCDYLSADDAKQYIPVVSSIMRALQTKDPQLVPELIENQAQQIVEGWVVMANVANKAVEICKQLTQASRAETINNELRHEWNGQTEDCH